MKRREALEIAGKKWMIINSRRDHAKKYWEFMYYWLAKVFVHDDRRRTPEILTDGVATDTLIGYLQLHGISFEKMKCVRSGAPSPHGSCFQFLVGGEVPSFMMGS